MAADSSSYTFPHLVRVLRRVALLEYIRCIYLKMGYQPLPIVQIVDVETSEYIEYGIRHTMGHCGPRNVWGIDPERESKD